jgi:predicted nucleic acid-binding protein
VISYVLHASVAAKWVLPREQEPRAAEAEVLLRRFSSRDCNLVVPDLFWPEMGNILWKAARSGRITTKPCEAAFAALQGSGLRTDALAFDRTVYHSEYVALAVESNVPLMLITADERMVNALSARFPVRWLGAVSL